MTTRNTFSRAHLLGAALAAALALPRAAAGQDSVPKAPPAPAVVEVPPASPPAPPTSPPTPTPERTQSGGGSTGGGSTSGAGRPRQSTAGGTAREEKGTPRPRVATPRPAGAGGAATAPSAPSPAEMDTASSAAPGANATTTTTASDDTGTRVVGQTPGASSATGGGPSWLAGTAVAALALLLAGQGAVIVLLGRIGREMRTFAPRLSIRERHMATQPESAVPDPPEGVSAGPRSDRPLVPVPPDDTGPDSEGEKDSPPLREDAPGPGPVVPVSDSRRRARSGVRIRLPRRARRRREEAPPASPGGSHALYVRARARLAELQEERGEKDRARLSTAAERFGRRKAWIVALHEAWENDVDFAYLGLLQKPGAGAVKDPYVMVYPLSEHDWEASRQGLRRLARHIDALPDGGHPHWPALLPLTALRSSVDFDLRVQPPDDASLAAAFHARRVLTTLLVNLKTLRRAQAELGRLVQWVVEAAPAAEARLADVSPQALAILDAVCAAGRSEEEREAGVDAAIAELDAMDTGNFDAVRAAEDRAEKLEQRYHAFLKVLFRAVDGVDRARALHVEALANGAAGEPWLAGWGAILEELDELLVRRVLGGRLEIAPIACGRGDALDTDLHNPLGAEPVQGVEKDQVWRVESRGFAYTENGTRRVVRPVDVIVAVPVSA